MLTSDRFTGVLAAALTPLDQYLFPDLNLMVNHCNWLLSNGCDGLAILGTTGEANSFSVQERIEIIQGLVDNGIPGEKLLPGTGSCSVPDAVESSKMVLFRAVGCQKGDPKRGGQKGRPRGRNRAENGV